MSELTESKQQTFRDIGADFLLLLTSPQRDATLVDYDAHRVPARFKLHSALRQPNGNDYGRADLAQWHAQHSGD
ncbi:hypothetical protein [Agromyces sp. Soil535]|uniref:hypothetical protein n=1 Tax=Agromyces sp. Soil535 TaxID=1736390 RepID=UPI0012E3B33D|nr:hypothetical protein [Agromyces sp. Soil535]